MTSNPFNTDKSSPAKKKQKQNNSVRFQNNTETNNNNNNIYRDTSFAGTNTNSMNDSGNNNNNNAFPQSRNYGITSAGSREESDVSHEDIAVAASAHHQQHDEGTNASSHDDTDQDLDSMNLDTSSSGSSSRSGSRGNKKPVISMPVLMTCLIGIPILFLVIFSSIPLSDALNSQRILANHRSIFFDILYIARRLEECRLYSTQYLSSPSNSSDAAAYAVDIHDVRLRSNARVQVMLRTMQESDLEYKHDFIEQSQGQIDELSAARQRIDDRNINIPAANEYLLTLIEKVFGLMGWIAKDPRIERTPLGSRIMMLVTLRRIGNSLGTVAGLGTTILNGKAPAADRKKIHKEIYAMHVSINRELILVRTVGAPEAVASIESWVHSADSKRFFKMLDNVMTEDPLIYANTSAEEFFETGEKVYAMIDSSLIPVVDVITSGDMLNKVAVDEGMKMFGAVLACLFALAAVIYYNNKEQTRLEKALESTAVLAAAVQRFVPKHQLKTMGMRSITQVQAGMTTEVAQTLIFSDIRRFTQLSESMTRLELFDWLQNYVARMTKVVSEENSYISNFLGDGLFVVSSSESSALRASIKMHVSVEELNVNLIAAGSKTPVQIGIGVHAGIVVAGIFGDQSRLTATFVATDVNLAARLEHLTKSFGSKILASDAVIDQISPDVFAFRFVGKVVVEGSERQIEAYDVFNADALETKLYKEETREQFENAVRLGTEDPAAALVALRAISEIAASRAISDMAVESRIVAALKDLEVDDNDEQESSMNEGGSSNNTNASTPTTAAVPKRNTYRKNSNSNGNNHHNRQLASSPSSTGVLCFSKDGGIKSSGNRNSSAAGSIPRAESSASLMGSEQPSGDVNNGNHKNNNVVNNNNNSDSSVIRQNRVPSSANNNIANINNKQNLIVDVQDNDEENEEHGYHHQQQQQQVSSTNNTHHRQTHSTRGSIHSASVKTYAAAAPASQDITSSDENEDIINSNNNTKTEKYARGQQQQPQYPRRANPYKTDDMMTNDNNDDEEVEYYHNNDENSRTALPHGLPEQQQGKSPLLRR